MRSCGFIFAILLAGAAVLVAQSPKQDNDALAALRKAVEERPASSLAHYELAEALFERRDYMGSVNEFREAIGGDLRPKWVEVWSHISLGKIFDTTGQREREINEYRRAIRTGDDTRGAQAEAGKYLTTSYKRH